MTQTSTRLRRLFSDIALFALSSFGSKILVFLLTPLYTYCLTTNEYGIADLIRTSVNLIYPILTLAISEAVLRFSMEDDIASHKVLHNGLLFVLISSAFLFLLYPLCSRFFPDIQRYWPVFATYYLLFNLQDCLGNYSKAIGKTKVFAINGLLQTCAVLILSTLFLVVLRWGLKGYLSAILISALIPVVYLFFAAGIHRTFFSFSIDPSLLRKMLIYSLPMIPSILAWSVGTSIDKYMIIGFIGVGASGIYSVAHKIPSLITTVLNIFLQAWQLNAISVRNSSDEAEYYNKVYTGLRLISLFGCLTVVILSKPLAKLLFAPSYYEAWQCVPMLTIAALFTSLSGFLAAPFRAHKTPSPLFISTGIGALVNLALNLILIQLIGIIGAAVATAVSFFSVWLVRLVTVQRFVRIRISSRELISYLILFSFAFLVTYELTNDLFIFTLSIVACIALFHNDLRKLMQTAVRIVHALLQKKQFRKRP